MQADFKDYFTALATLAGPGVFLSLSLVAALAAFKPESFARVRNVAVSILCFFALSAELFVAVITSIAQLLPEQYKANIVVVFDLAERVYLLGVLAAFLGFAVLAWRLKDARKAFFGFAGAGGMLAVLKPAAEANHNIIAAAWFVPVMIGFSMATLALVTCLLGLIPFWKDRPLSALFQES